MVLWDRENLGTLRGAIFRGDGAAVVEVVRDRLTDEVLQHAGDGLLDALGQGVPGAIELAAQCSVGLRNRSWRGDAELADQLEAALGRGGTPMLRPVPVDLELLSSFLGGDPLRGGARLDVTTGEVWSDEERVEQDEDDENRWLDVEHIGSSYGYDDMEVFIDTVTDPTKADLLRVAITGKGAFRRFKDVLSRWPDERERYYLMSADRQLGRAREWLADQGFRPSGAASRRH
jgi:hypothetical protein